MHIFLIAALSADGFIAENKDHLSTKWTSREDLKFFTKRTKKAGLMVMGSSTFKTINRPLPDRKIFVYTSNPAQYEQYNHFQVEPVSMEPHELAAKAEEEGFEELAICGGASIYTQFMKTGIVDTLYLTKESFLFGKGMTLFTEEIDTEIELQKVHQLSSQTLVMEYKVKK